MVPHWPAQAWFQGLASIADEAETRPLHEVASPPGWLPGSARHALSGAMLALSSFLFLFLPPFQHSQDNPRTQLLTALFLVRSFYSFHGLLKDMIQRYEYNDNI